VRIVGAMPTATTNKTRGASRELTVEGIRQERESRGLTREQLAIRAKCSVTMLGQIERGVIPTRGIVVDKVLRALEEAA
jgi:transcriptional regulator with XRE-family HTH domain